MRRPAPRVWLHHTVTAASPAQQIVRQIERDHRAKFGVGPGYSFLVELGNGVAYEGQGWGWVGAHTGGDNSLSHGIAVIGNLQDRALTAVARQTIVELIVGGVYGGHIADPPTIGAHGDAPRAQTACPGRHGRAALDAIRAAVTDELARPVTPQEAAMRFNLIDFALAPGMDPDNKGRIPFWGVDKHGAVFAFNGAPDYGAVNRLDGEPAHDDIVGIQAYAAGYVIVRDDGHQEPDGSWNASTYVFQR